MADKEVDGPTGVETTGHSWDGIKELNSPLPRWWLIVLWATVLWSIGYWVVMPSWPGVAGYLKGARNHSERANVEKAVEDLDALRGARMNRLLSVASIDDIERDPDLEQFALTAGASLFANNCATCHGAGGAGGIGYPTLVDDDWLWGGALSDIQMTVRHGVRSGAPDSRTSVMQPFGRDGMLRPVEISDLVEFVIGLAGEAHNETAAGRAAPLFAQHCASCHGAEGRGGRQFGAPNLTDAISLYGSDRAAIHATIYGGRNGVMPAWSDKLSEAQITALAIYVHSLGGGE